MLDFTGIVLTALQGTFARPIVVHPFVSQPGASAYSGRGVYATTPAGINIENSLVFSDQRTSIWIRIAEYPIQPALGDQIDIPANMNYPAEGRFEVSEKDAFADGKVVLMLKKLLHQ